MKPMAPADPHVIMVGLHTSVANSSLCSPQWICIDMSIDFLNDIYIYIYIYIDLSMFIEIRTNIRRPLCICQSINQYSFYYQRPQLIQPSPGQNPPGQNLPGQKPPRKKAPRTKTAPIFGSTKSPPDINPQRRNATSH